MELELGIKLARVADEFTSADLRIAKDREGPLFLSRETDTRFILIAHLRGYKKRNIKIEINEDGTQIVISGEKAIQETVIVRWKLYKKETEIRRFRKAFKIPKGSILDKIKAKFDEDESTLTISMPKQEKGIRGFIIEEVKEQAPARGDSETLPVAVDHDFPPERKLEEGMSASDEEAKNSAKYDHVEGKSPKAPETANAKEPKEGLGRIESEEIQTQNIYDMKEKDQSGQTLPDEVSEGSEDPTLASTAKAPAAASHISTNGVPQVESQMHDQGEPDKETISRGIQGKMEMEHDQHVHSNDQVCGRAEDVQEEAEEESSAVVKPPEGAQEHRPSSVKGQKGRCKLCTPIVAGSALLLSIVVFVIHFIRKKSQPSKRKD